MSTNMKVIEWKQVKECLDFASNQLRKRFSELTSDLDLDEDFEEMLNRCDKDADYNYLLGMLEGFNVMAHAIYNKEHKEWYKEDIMKSMYSVDKELVS